MDVTQEWNAQALLRRAQTAAVAASDLNDELTIILGSLDEIRRQAAVGGSIQLHCTAATEAARRASWKVSHLLNWAARAGAKPTAMTLERLLEQAR